MQDRITVLKDYLEKIPSLELAFVFGSRAEDKIRKDSDWDIGIYFKPEEWAEIETERDYLGFASMRNIIIHEYLDIRWKRIKISERCKDILPAFIKKIKEILEVRDGTL